MYRIILNGRRVTEVVGGLKHQSLPGGRFVVSSYGYTIAMSILWEKIRSRGTCPDPRRRATFNMTLSYRIALITALLLCTGCRHKSRPPNIVLIYVDDLGWKDLGYMGSTYYETPHIDRLAKEGKIFSNAYANAPNCAPSRASIMTGLYTPRHGIYTVGTSERGSTRQRKLIPTITNTRLDTSFVTITERLQSTGYVTGHFGKWHLGDNSFLPTDQGFDVNVAGDDRGSPPSYFYPYERGNNRLPDLGKRGEEGEYLTDRLTDEALTFIESNADRPFFLYLSHYAVHTPLQAKPALVEKYRSKQGDVNHNHPTYAAMIESLDQGVDRILSQLDSLGLYKNTVVVFFSDNGGYGPATSMVPLRGSKGMLYEGGIRVPLIVRWPGRIMPGTASDVPVTGIDLYPTFLDLAQVEVSVAQHLDGDSLVPLLLGTAPIQARALFWHFPAYLEAYTGMEGPWRTTPAGAVRQDAYKLIEFFEDGRLELYNLEDDIGELHNLAGEMPAKVQELYTLMQAWRTDVQAPVPSISNPSYDPY